MNLDVNLAPENGSDCDSNETTFRLTYQDYYTRQPICGVPLEVSEGGKTVFKGMTNLQGYVLGGFYHSPNNWASYYAWLLPSEHYAWARGIGLQKGCKTVKTYLLKPTTKLGIWVKNLSDEAVFLNSLSIQQKTNNNGSELYQGPFSLSKNITEALPAKNDWRLFWFEALPEEKVDIKLAYNNNRYIEEEIMTGRDSVTFYMIRIR